MRTARANTSFLFGTPGDCLSLFILLSVSACGGGGGGGGKGGGDAGSYTISGSVSGLAGSGLKVRANSTDVAIASNGSVAFLGGLPSGTAYSITVVTQPSTPAQVCTVSNASGTLSGSNVTNVAIACTTTPMSLSSSTPAVGGTDAARTVTPRLTFSVPVDAATAVPSNISLESAAGAQPITLSVSGADMTVTPTNTLLPLTSYTLRIGTGLHGSAGEPLASPVTISFTTEDRQWQTPVVAELDPNLAQFPQIELDRDGNALAVWTVPNTIRPADDFTVRVNRFTAGSGWGTEAFLPLPSGDVRDADIAIDASGNALAVWAQHDGAIYHVSSARYTAGIGWGAPVLIEQDDRGNALRPQVAFDAAGNAIAVWEQFDGTRSTVMSNRYAPGFGWATTPEPIETDAGVNLTSNFAPQIAIAPEGTAVVVWLRGQAGTLRQDLWSNRYTPGTGWHTPELIETNDAGSVIFPSPGSLAIDASGNAIAVWQQYDGSTGDDIWSNRYTAGVGWGTAEVIETDTGQASSPQIASDPSGNALAVWQQENADQLSVIWSNRYTAGSGWGEPVRVQIDDTHNAEVPRIAIDASGNALAVWEQADGTRLDVWSNRYTASGWGNAALIEHDDLSSARDPWIAICANGEAMAVWQQSDGGAPSIWSARFE